MLLRQAAQFLQAAPAPQQDAVGLGDHRFEVGSRGDDGGACGFKASGRGFEAVGVVFEVEDHGRDVERRFEHRRRGGFEAAQELDREQGVTAVLQWPIISSPRLSGKLGGFLAWRNPPYGSFGRSQAPGDPPYGRPAVLAARTVGTLGPAGQSNGGGALEPCRPSAPGGASCRPGPRFAPVTDVLSNPTARAWSLR